MQVFIIMSLYVKGSFDDEPICGRPLGMRMDNEGYLVVADAYLGIFKINVATGGHSSYLDYLLSE